MAKEGHRPPIDPSLPACLTDLIKRCWAHKASDRPSMAQVVATLEEIEADEDLSSMDVMPIAVGGC